jgi:hypothetical protein
MIMKFTFIRLIIFMGFSGFLVTSVLAGALTNVPTALTASIGGFLGTSYSVKWQNGVLNYSASEDGKTIDSAKIIPSSAQWKEFRKTLNRLNVWKWHDNYHNTNNILDGTQWSLEITYVDCSLKTDGSNSYPEANGKPNNDPTVSKEFGK